MAYDPKDAESLGVATFAMMGELLKRLHQKKVLDFHDVTAVLRAPLQAPPMPGSGFEVTKDTRDRLTAQIQLWNKIDGPPQTR